MIKIKINLFGRLVCAACGLLPIIVFVAMLVLPETPPWLVLQVMLINDCDPMMILMMAVIPCHVGSSLVFLLHELINVIDHDHISQLIPQLPQFKTHLFVNIQKPKDIGG